jgi:hypothetical protein
MGSDILRQHDYMLEFGYDFEAQRPQYVLNYRNNQFLPQIALTFWDMALPYNWENNSTLWLREEYGSIAFTLYDSRVLQEWDFQMFSVGYEQINLGNISSIESLSTKPSLGNINGLLLVYRYVNARSYPKSISPEKGMDLTLGVTLNSADLGSKYVYTTYRADGTAFLPTPFPHHVLAPTLYGFYSKGDLLAQSNYSWRNLPIRGYPSTNLRGNKGVLLATEYRFPLFYPESGFMYGATFFDKIWGDVFYDVGGAKFGSISGLKLKRSYGLELNLDIQGGWSYGLTLKFGYVNGVDEGGEEKFYVSLAGML